MMLKLLIYLYMTILCGCGLEYRDNSTIFGHISNHQKRVLPESFVECLDGYYFTTNRFFEESFIDKSSVRQKNMIYVLASTPDTGPHRSGTFFRGGFNGGYDNLLVCHEIYGKLIGLGFMDTNTLYQYFDREKVKNLINIHNSEAIEEALAVLHTDFYEYPDGSSKEEKYSYSISIPLDVKCENKWQVKRDLTHPLKVIFKEPDGRCIFSTRDYDFTLLSGKKVVVAINGFYEKDSELDNKRILVEISRFGFKYVD